MKQKSSSSPCFSCSVAVSTWQCYNSRSTSIEGIRHQRGPHKRAREDHEYLKHKPRQHLVYSHPPYDAREVGSEMTPLWIRLWYTFSTHGNARSKLSRTPLGRCVAINNGYTFSRPAPPLMLNTTDTPFTNSSSQNGHVALLIKRRSKSWFASLIAEHATTGHVLSSEGLGDMIYTQIIRRPADEANNFVRRLWGLGWKKSDKRLMKRTLEDREA